MGAKIREVYQGYLDARKEVYGDRDKPVCLMDMATIYPKVAKKRGGMQGLDVSEKSTPALSGTSCARIRGSRITL